MTLTQLRQFVALSQAGSFVKAAALLHITQPALSRSVKSLEDELGQLLFDRVGRRIELTVFGRQTLLRASALIDDAAQLKSSGRQPDADSAGRLRLGLGSGPGVILTAAILGHFAQHHQKVHVDIFRANTEALARMLREREIDAMVVDMRSLRPSPDLHLGTIHEMAGAFMCRKEHPLLRLSRVSFELLSAYPIASTPLSDEVARLLVERYGPAAHPQEMVRLSSDEISHLVEVATHSDTVLLAIREAAPQLAELRISPALSAKARFAMVTLAHRSESMYLDTVRTLMARRLGR